MAHQSQGISHICISCEFWPGLQNTPNVALLELCVHMDQLIEINLEINVPYNILVSLLET